MRADHHFITSLVVVFVVSLAHRTPAATPVTVTIDVEKKGATIPAEFPGLSFETKLILASADGRRYFRPDNAPLVAMFKTLNVRSLRIGGNTADRATVPMPSDADIDSLFEFARAADVKVIYTLRLRESRDPAAAARVAKHIWDRYRDNVLCFAIGNEPDMYVANPDAYCELMRTYMAAIDAPGVAPGAKFSGPGSTPNKVAWSRTLAERLGPEGRLRLITQHIYPGGAATKIAVPATGRSAMLSDNWVRSYQKFHDTFVPEVKRQKLGYRLEECNSFYYGGRDEVSNTFASALWALELMYWWAAHDCDGINLHTVDTVTHDEPGERKPGHYTPISGTASGGYRAWPIAYGMKAFGLGSGGTLVGADVKSQDPINLAAYAVLGSDGAVCLTLINKSLDADARDATVTVTLDKAPTGVRTIALLAANADPSAKDGTTLGGGTVDERGAFDGKWTERPITPDALAFDVPSASALVVRIER